LGLDDKPFLDDDMGQFTTGTINSLQDHLLSDHSNVCPMHYQPLAPIHATHAFSLHTEITMENQLNSPDASATRNNGILNLTSTSNPNESHPTGKCKSIALLVIKQEALRYLQSCSSNQQQKS
jgi:hypothetical protein